MCKLSPFLNTQLQRNIMWNRVKGGNAGLVLEGPWQICSPLGRKVVPDTDNSMDNLHYLSRQA